MLTRPQGALSPPGGLSINDDEPDDADENDSEKSPLIVRNLQSERAVLRILRRTPGKAPRLFEIMQLDMKDVGGDHPWPFRANFTNPKPPGRIRDGRDVRPWQAEEPSQTPLAASYRFENADLGVFDGIAGILTSSGSFKGVLERIEVDGTNGNTLLRPVEATLGATKIHTSGGVVERDNEDGRTVELDVVIDDARLEDILHLAVKGPQPPMIGVIKLAWPGLNLRNHRSGTKWMRSAPRPAG